MARLAGLYACVSSRRCGCGNAGRSFLWLVLLWGLDCGLAAVMAWRARGVDGQGADAVAEGEGLLAGVEHISGGQARAEAVGEVAQARPGPRCGRWRRL
jgi:hypothetical protein